MTNLGKGSRKGLTDGLREFIKVDNEGAIARHGNIKVRKPKALEGRSDVMVRESPDELDIEG